MGVVELLGVASSVSLLAGWRIYRCVFVVGLAMRFHRLPMPIHSGGLDVLANPYILAAAGSGLVAELFADNVVWFDSLWDAVHTAVRPVGGAMLALAIIDPAVPSGESWHCYLAGAQRWRRTAQRRGRAHSSMPALNLSATSLSRPAKIW